MQSVSHSPVPVLSKFNICIPGRTEVLVNYHLPKSHRQQLGMTSPLDNADSPSCLFAAYTVCQAEDREIVVRLMNTSHADIEIQAGQKVSSFCPLVETYAPHSFQESKQQLTATCCTDNASQLASQLAEQIDPSLPAHAKATILNTLLQFPDVSNDGLGHTTVLEHKIDTGSSPPIRKYPRRLPYAYREETKSQVADMLTEGVIQPSSSPWASPIVLVKKKDGTYRFCVDYRKLNLVTKTDAHPLPQVDGLLEDTPTIT